MSINTIGVFVSCLSFYAYVASYFMSPHMKNEFKRFNLEKIGLITVGLEFLGATGLWVGLFFPLILTLSSLGLSLLMLCGLIVRIQLKDSWWISLPAGFFMLLNAYIFYFSLGSL
jgi:hypothetical protein